MGQISLIWDRVVSYGTEQAHIGESNFIWERAGSYGKEQSHMERAVSVRKNSLMWEIAVRDRDISCGT